MRMMSDKELVSLYRRLEGARSAIKGLQRQLARVEAERDDILRRYNATAEHVKEWPPHAVKGIQDDNLRLMQEVARLQRELTDRSERGRSILPDGV